jgi:hypothetical protein
MMNDFIKNLYSFNSNRIIFAHNLGKFDSYFILKILLEMNKKVNLLIDDQNSIIYMEFKNKKGKIISFKDSLRILPRSLKDLSKIYGVKYQK